jgi:hypothetical protein
MVVGIQFETRAGELRDLTDEGISVIWIPSDKRQVLFLRVSVSARRAAEMNERRLRGVDGAEAGASGAETVIDVVVRDLEVGFVETV